MVNLCGQNDLVFLKTTFQEGKFGAARIDAKFPSRRTNKKAPALPGPGLKLVSQSEGQSHLRHSALTSSNSQ